MHLDFFSFPSTEKDAGKESRLTHSRCGVNYMKSLPQDTHFGRCQGHLVGKYVRHGIHIAPKTGTVVPELPFGGVVRILG